MQRADLGYTWIFDCMVGTPNLCSSRVNCTASSTWKAFLKYLFYETQ